MRSLVSLCSTGLNTSTTLKLPILAKNPFVSFCLNRGNSKCDRGHWHQHVSGDLSSDCHLLHPGRGAVFCGLHWRGATVLYLPRSGELWRRFQSFESSSYSTLLFCIPLHCVGKSFFLCCFFEWPVQCGFSTIPWHCVLSSFSGSVCLLPCPTLLCRT